LTKNNLDAYILTSCYPHYGECIPLFADRVRRCSGFKGSAGTVVVTKAAATVLVDPRYAIEVKSAVDPHFFTPFVFDKVSGTQWKCIVQPDGVVRKNGGVQRIGFDPLALSGSAFRDMNAHIAKIDKETDRPELVAIDGNLFDQAAGELPRSTAPWFVHKHTDNSVADRIARVRTLAADGLKATHLVVACTDQVSWLLNVRCMAVTNMVGVIAFAIVPVAEGEPVTLFADRADMQENGVDAVLEAANVVIEPYDSFSEALKTLASSGARLACDTARCASTPHFISDLCQDEAVIKASTRKLFPVLEGITYLTDAEIAHSFASHLRDSAAITSFLAWAEKQGLAESGVTEFDCVEKGHEFRARREHFLGPSFDSIVGFNENAAIIHHKPSATERGPALTRNTCLLIDSGGHYLDGTTDVTRTIWIGPDAPSAELVRAYTIVLRGHVAMAMAKVAQPCTYPHVDALCKAEFWQEGLDYAHGTGHGVGYLGGVHNSIISSAHVAYGAPYSAPPLHENCIFTIEPGLYDFDAGYGVRIESDYVTQTTDRTHPTRKTPFLKFTPLTIVPFERALIDVALLTRPQIDYLNEFAAQVRQQLTPLLKGEDPLGLAYMKRQTEPLPYAQ
jgi:Xaa-Pro aminopeptidase